MLDARSPPLTQRGRPGERDAGSEFWKYAVQQPRPWARTSINFPVSAAIVRSGRRDEACFIATSCTLPSDAINRYLGRRGSRGRGRSAFRPPRLQLGGPGHRSVVLLVDGGAAIGVLDLALFDQRTGSPLWMTSHADHPHGRANAGTGPSMAAQDADLARRRGWPRDRLAAPCTRDPAPAMSAWLGVEMLVLVTTLGDCTSHGWRYVP